MATEYTPNCNLDLYASADKPNLRDQYNAAMGKIDTQMKVNADSIVSANNNISTLQTTVGQHTEKISSIETEQGVLSVSIDNVQATVAQHTSQIGTLQTNVQNNSSDIGSIQSTVDLHTQNISDIQESIETQQIQLNGKAPKNHASSATDYGIATTTQYGHAMLDNESNLGNGSSNKAATSELVQKMVAQKLTFNNVVNGSMPSNWSGWGGCLMNYDKSLWKFWGSWGLSSSTINYTAIPGSNRYGVKFTLDEPFTDIESYMEFPCCGYVTYTKSGQSGQAIHATVGLAIGTDGHIYLNPYSQSTFTLSGATKILFTFVQTILTRIDLDIATTDAESYALMVG